MKITNSLNSAISDQLVQISFPVLLLSVNISTRNLVHVDCSVCIIKTKQKILWSHRLIQMKSNVYENWSIWFSTFSILLKLSKKGNFPRGNTYVTKINGPSSSNLIWFWVCIYIFKKPDFDNCKLFQMKNKDQIYAFLIQVTLKSHIIAIKRLVKQLFFCSYCFVKSFSFWSASLSNIIGVQLNELSSY